MTFFRTFDLLAGTELASVVRSTAEEACGDGDLPEAPAGGDPYAHAAEHDPRGPDDGERRALAKANVNSQSQM